MLHSSVSISTCLVQQTKPFHVVKSSNEFASYFRYNVDELQGRSLKLLQSPDSGAFRFEDMITALKSSNQQECEVQLRMKDCTSCCVRVRASTTKIMDKCGSFLAIISLEESAIKDEEDKIPSLPDTIQDDLNTDSVQKPYVHVREREKTSKFLLSHQPSSTTPATDSRSSAEENLSCLLSQQSCKVFTCIC